MIMLLRTWLAVSGEMTNSDAIFEIAAPEHVPDEQSTSENILNIPSTISGEIPAENAICT